MIGKVLPSIGAVLILAGQIALAADGDQAVADKLLPDHAMVLPWIIGVGILVATLIAGFKHPGRTHLD